MLISEMIKINEAQSLHEIREALMELLYVPNEYLKPKIIEEYCIYLETQFKNENNEIKIFIARDTNDFLGIASCHIHLSYTSYGRKCGTIGWFQVNDLMTCKELIAQCELFFIQRNIHKVRCGINFPKSLGGIGFQVQGHDEQMLYGVSFSSPKQKEILYLQKLGYHAESDYTCLRVSAKTWKKGKKINNNIRFEYIPIKEMKDKAEDIQKLAEDSFQGLLPDTSGGRYNEFIHAFKEMPKSKQSLIKDIKLTDLTTDKTFLNAWETCDLEQITPLMPMAYDKKSGDLIGVLLGLPDLYQHWNEKKITRVNVDTAIVRREYKGKGIFSALNNIGQLTCRLYGMKYFEGTTVWTGNSRGVNNTDAIQSIIPHSISIRKHVIMQKRLKKNKNL